MTETGTTTTPDLLDIEEARRRTAGRLRRTPLVVLEPGPFSDIPLIAKLELLQHTGSFKARGALNAVLSLESLPDVGIVTASGGNHGQAVAWAAKLRGTPATIFIPDNTPSAKVDAILRHGAVIHRAGEAYADALVQALAFRDRTGATFVHAYDDPRVVAGQGMVGAEFLDQLDEIDESVDTVLVAVGGGGLAAGIALALSGKAAVVAVEPRRCPTFHEALRHGGPVDVAVSGVASDALGAARLGGHAWEILKAENARSVLIEDEQIIKARTDLWRHVRLAAEPGGVAALAAIQSGAYRPEPGERVAVILCGSNTTPHDLS